MFRLLTAGIAFGGRESQWSCFRQVGAHLPAKLALLRVCLFRLEIRSGSQQAYGPTIGERTQDVVPSPIVSTKYVG